MPDLVGLSRRAGPASGARDIPLAAPPASGLDILRADTWLCHSGRVEVDRLAGRKPPRGRATSSRPHLAPVLAKPSATNSGTCRARSSRQKRVASPSDRLDGDVAVAGGQTGEVAGIAGDDDSSSGFER